eukprot:9417693-Ditylum_brightwellii.AAC.1
MEIDAFHEDYGKQTAWDKYSNNSDNKGDWIKALVEKCGSKKSNRYGIDSRTNQAAPMLNHDDAMTKSDKAVEEKSQRDANLERPENKEQ